MANCEHPEVTSLNPYEPIRKYRCGACRGVMMCKCDEEFGRRFLSYQLSHGTESETSRQVPVTLGFQASVCRECRGLPAEAHPVAAIHGRTSKIRRYYWREILFETVRRVAALDDAAGRPRSDAAGLVRRRDAYREVEREVVKELSERHKDSPKYVFQDAPQSAVLERYGIEMLDLRGTYVTTEDRKVRLMLAGETVTAEQFASVHFSRQGYGVLFMESAPFHVLFGVYMWLLIQGMDDPRCRIVGFGDRFAFDAGTQAPPVTTRLPEDFGTPGYASRRAAAVDEHFALSRLDDRRELLWLFDYWLEPSADLRQYLWAHRDRDVETARKLVSILPAPVIAKILRYFVGNYWHRYLGWPDLLVYRGDEYFFAEVKSSKDELSENQRSWITANATDLGLPFKLVKIHRVTSANPARERTSTTRS